ncbi:hypothetical protein [Acinetobacter indicus]|uniref:hypothetical protein n=1 Tax=Acinetobacter indicus TaxID=756892 RepID=UPI003989FAC8
MNRKKILYFGSLPPPVGGVSVFNEKFTTYLKENNNVFFFSFTNLFRFYNISFINYSVTWKRFIAVLISFFICKKTVVIVHSSQFEMGFFNFLTMLMCTKVLTTSNKVVDNSIMKHKFIKVNGLLFKEFFSSKVAKNKIDKSQYTILFYQFNNDRVNGEYIYGSDKMLNLLDNIRDNHDKLSIKVIWIDLSGEMEVAITPYFDFVEYIKKPVDLNKYWKDVDLLIRPTLFDGTAFMLVEALLNGVNVLCSNLPDRPVGVHIIESEFRDISYNQVEDLILSDSILIDFEDLLPSINSFLCKI